MEVICLVGGVIAGIVIGAVVTFLLARASRVQSQADLQMKLQLAEQQARQSCIRGEEISKEARAKDQRILDLETQNKAGLAELSRQKEIATRVPGLELDIKNVNAKAELFAASAKKFETEAARIPTLEAQLSDRDVKTAELNASITAFTSREATFNARVDELNRAHEALKTAFTALASEALQKNNEMFLQVAKAQFEKTQSEGNAELEKKQKSFEDLVKPIKDGLEKYESEIQRVEKERATMYGELTNELKTVNASSVALRDQTSNLINALRTPTVKGQWGEVQLRRVVELAGMQEHCDFETQVHIDGDNGRLRPDMVVRMPGNKSIVVDSKVPTKAYLEAFECTDPDARKQKLLVHCEQMRAHIKNLSSKAYWDQFDNTPEFVFMFLPRESVYFAAVEIDHALFEDAANQRVILATPATLIVLLRSVAFGWRQEQIAENAKQISETGRKLYDCVRVFGEHFAKVGKGLETAVKSYNSAAGSLETRLLTQARAFKALRATDAEELPSAEVVETAPRLLQSTDFFPEHGVQIVVADVSTDETRGFAPVT